MSPLVSVDRWQRRLEGFHPAAAQDGFAAQRVAHRSAVAAGSPAAMS